MKILWIDLNSSYAHSSLALPALHAQLMENDTYEWDIVSATINDNVGTIASNICVKEPDIIAGSLWLFNHESMMHITSRVKAVLPHVKLILGGPEFLGDNESFLRKNPFDLEISVAERAVLENGFKNKSEDEIRNLLLSASKAFSENLEIDEKTGKKEIQRI